MEMPNETDDVAQVFFDSDSDHRKFSNPMHIPRYNRLTGDNLGRHQAAPLTAFLRVPLTWYQSTTYSYYPDETHTSIRRQYSSPSYPHSKRQFCGYCGTPLSYWTEEPHTEAEFILLTLGSLVGEDLSELEELGLLPAEAVVDAKAEKEMMSAGSAGASSTMPWFETLIKGSPLGNMNRSRGKARSKDGNLKVEWEIIEWDNDEEDMGTVGKRKLDDTDGAQQGGTTGPAVDDVQMKE